ncbi:MAG: ABC transporter permease subunit [Chloroflexota bacterium]|nr:ABC transporter permease subunit [Chloroflexota bacterium]
MKVGLGRLPLRRWLPGSAGKNLDHFAQDKITGSLLIVPALFIVFVVMLIPLAYGLLLSVTDFQLGDAGLGNLVFLDNYIKALRDETFFQALRTTLIFTAGVLAAELALGVLIAVLLMSFINDIPADLISSAIIDGCSKMQVFWKIVFPLLRPALASAVILAMQLSWNELLFSLQLTDVNTYTLPVGIAKFVGSISVDWGKSSAAAAVTMAPMIIIGFFLQKYLVQGMTMGSVKG